MHLLNTKDTVLKEFSVASEVPPYAILSHRWSEREMSFQDIRSGDVTRRTQKITNCCKQARIDGYEWIWVDTCCIDRTNSSELTEAINSMYVWYGQSDVCYAYLEDVRGGDDPRRSGSLFMESTWFRRGWTLQELIAPLKVMFLAKDWSDIGSKKSLVDIIHNITGVPPQLLRDRSKLRKFSVAQKFSWAAFRETTRDEDRAYSLMGLFGIHMPTIYGEGKQAFIRLQQEIMRRSNDQTIFAWAIDPSASPSWQGLLAPSPAYFHSSGSLVAMDDADHRTHFSVDSTSQLHFSMTNYGTHIQLPLRKLDDTDSNVYLAALACRRMSDHDHKIPCIRLSHIQNDRYIKESPTLAFLEESEFQKFIIRDVYIKHDDDPHSEMLRINDASIRSSCAFFIHDHILRHLNLELKGVSPPRMWARDAEVTDIPPSQVQDTPLTSSRMLTQNTRDTRRVGFASQQPLIESFSTWKPGQRESHPDYLGTAMRFRDLPDPRTNHLGPFHSQDPRSVASYKIDVIGSAHPSMASPATWDRDARATGVAFYGMSAYPAEMVGIGPSSTLASHSNVFPPVAMMNSQGVPPAAPFGYGIDAGFYPLWNQDVNPASVVPSGIWPPPGPPNQDPAAVVVSPGPRDQHTELTGTSAPNAEHGLLLTIDGHCELRCGTAVFEERSTGDVFAIILGADRAAESSLGSPREVWLDLVVRDESAIWQDLPKDFGNEAALRIQEKYQDPSSLWYSASTKAIRSLPRKQVSGKLLESNAEITLTSHQESRHLGSYFCKIQVVGLQSNPLHNIPSHRASPTHENHRLREDGIHAPKSLQWRLFGI
ncbi:hypothetical protein A0H81_10513 [Grifola frondosa]|uniref:Uncharacterized protein n=1 Tax=Grifola frondosa TaxID=5627 RepID=A0A1C7LZB7_GRIFR|nr:hypothetical protein A0H81_10513 [Grifola frondosa]